MEHTPGVMERSPGVTHVSLIRHLQMGSPELRQDIWQWQVGCQATVVQMQVQKREADGQADQVRMCGAALLCPLSRRAPCLW